MKTKPDLKRDRESITLPVLVATLLAAITSPGNTRETAGTDYDAPQLPDGVDTGGVSDTDFFIA